MTDKLYGVWKPTGGWLRLKRDEGGDYVAWATTEKQMARYIARQLRGKILRIDEALASRNGEEILLAAQTAAKERDTLWHKLVHKLSKRV
jgi:hypothetical protein